jgi:hypothetical protein
VHSDSRVQGAVLSNTIDTRSRDCSEGSTGSEEASEGAAPKAAITLTVLHNEVPVRLARCGNQFHCPWEQFVQVSRL